MADGVAYCGTMETAKAQGYETAAQIGARLAVSARTVRRWAAAGRIPAVRLNRRDLRFHWPTVEQVLTGKPVS